MKGSACTLCDSQLNELNRPLYETENLSVFPSVGGFVDGWFLVVPKVHVLNFAVTPADLKREAVNLCERLVLGLTSERIRPLVFEHGPNVAGSATGCSVDHAHLHVVAASVPIEALLDECEWSRKAGLLESLQGVGGQSYHLVSDFEKSYVSYGTERGSQYFRRRLAESLGEIDWNWRSSPVLDRFSLHRSIFQGAFDGVVATDELARTTT